MSSEALSCLLEDCGPAVGYVASRDLLADRPAPAALARMRVQALAWAPVQAILSKQRDDGRFAVAKDRRRPDSMGTLHMLTALRRCGADADVPEVRRALDWLLGRHVIQGAFSTITGGSGILPCYVGQFIATVLGLGGPEDREAALSSAGWLTEYERLDHRGVKAGGRGEWP